MASQLFLGAVATALVLLAASPATAPAQAQAPSQVQAPNRQHLASASVEALQHAYLECDHIATHTLLDLASAAHCSMVGEELKHRVFGGDFDRLVDWWRANKWVDAEAVSESQELDHGPDIR